MSSNQTENIFLFYFYSSLYINNKNLRFRLIQNYGTNIKLVEYPF